MLDMFQFMGMTALCLFGLELAFKGLVFGVKCVAAACFGWRPRIYHEGLANKCVAGCLEEFSRRECLEMSDQETQRLKDYGSWLLQVYTFDYATGRR
jgi:hypothetical protein